MRKIAIETLDGTIEMATDSCGKMQPIVTSDALINNIPGFKNIAYIHA
ncbi:hypothetical protein H710_00106 [Bartonella bacilliformis Ver097]|uniref:Uncharacterized protein n=1 Tax=Bartonella bacilliformis Ver097 TaxID=1293911 RepID=A0A072RI73_BARBA|nr:hypothetical protein H710_00106 [Bartonella bacilliformis Ver097]